MTKSNKSSNKILDKIILYLKNPLVWLSIIFLISVIVLIMMNRTPEKYICDLNTHDYDPVYGCLEKCPVTKPSRCGKTCYDPGNQKCLGPDNLCDTCQGECCAGSCVNDPSVEGIKICCNPEQVCSKKGQSTKCCGAGLVCVNGNCVPKCAPINSYSVVYENIQPISFSLFTWTITVEDNSNKWTDKMKVNISSSGTLPEPLSSSSSYYIIRVDNTHIRLANTIDDVTSGNYIKFTTTGDGIIKISSVLLDRSCNVDEECYHMTNIDKNSNTYQIIKNEMQTDQKIKEYPGVDQNHSDFYACKVKPNCSYLQAPFAVPASINNKYPSFNIQIPDGNTGFCSIKNANHDSSEDDAQYCYNTYKTSSDSCNQNPKCQWYDLLKTTKDNVSQMNSAISKATKQNDGLYCGKQGQRIFGKTEEENAKCLPTDCFIGIANSQTKQINYDAETKTCVALLDSKQPLPTNTILGNYKLTASNDQLQIIDLSNSDVGSSTGLSSTPVGNYPYMPDCDDTDKVNQLCSKTDSTYSFVANSSEECETDSGTLIQPNNYCGTGSTYDGGKCVCIKNGTKWDPSTYVQPARDFIPGCTTSLCYETGGKRCEINPLSYCNGKTQSFLGNANLNTDNPDCACNPAYKDKTCGTLVKMIDLFGRNNNIIPPEVAQEMINSGISISQGVFVLPGPGVSIDDTGISIQAGYPVDINADGRAGINTFLTQTWPNKWGCSKGYLFMNRDLFSDSINLCIKSRNNYTNNSFSSTIYTTTYPADAGAGPYGPITKDIRIFDENKSTNGDNIVYYAGDYYTQAAVVIIGAT